MKNPDFEISEEHTAREELLYIRKILGLLLLQVLVSSVVASLFSLVTPLYEFVESRWWLAIVVKIGLIPIGAVLFYVERVASNLCLSSIFGLLFTIGVGALFGTLLALCEHTTAIMFLCFFSAHHLAAYVHSYVEKNNYKVGKGVLAMVEVAVADLIIAVFILPSSKLYLLVVPFILGLYGSFLVFHSKMISQGKFRQIPRERYIIGALSIYVDFFMVKFYIIKWCCNRKDDEQEIDIVKKA